MSPGEESLAQALFFWSVEIQILALNCYKKAMVVSIETRLVLLIPPFLVELKELEIICPARHSEEALRTDGSSSAHLNIFHLVSLTFSF